MLCIDVFIIYYNYISTFHIDIRDGVIVLVLVLEHEYFLSTRTHTRVRSKVLVLVLVLEYITKVIILTITSHDYIFFI